MGKNYFMNGPLPEGGRDGMLVAGHSWAEGTFKGHEAEIGNALGMDVTVKTKIGSSISYATGEMENSPGRYRCAVLFTGINDYRNKPEEIIGKYDLLIKAALAKTDGRIYVVNVPYYDEAGKGRIDEINRGLRELAKKYPKVVYVDLNSELNAKKHPEYNPANLHPKNYDGIREFLVSEIGRNENAVFAFKLPLKAMPKIIF